MYVHVMHCMLSQSDPINLKIIGPPNCCIRFWLPLNFWPQSLVHRNNHFNRIEVMHFWSVVRIWPPHLLNQFYLTMLNTILCSQIMVIENWKYSIDVNCSTVFTLLINRLLKQVPNLISFAFHALCMVFVSLFLTLTNFLYGFLHENVPIEPIHRKILKRRENLTKYEFLI